MDGAAIMIPLRDTINIVTLTQCLIFAGFFLVRPKRREIAIWFLIAAFLILATVKADQLYQMLGGFRIYPQYGFVLAPFQAALTPVLYLFVCARTAAGFTLNKGHLWHLAPAALMTLYLTAIYYRLDTGDKIALIESGGLGAPMHRIAAPLIGDSAQLAYLIAAYRRVERFGVSLKNWFAAVENRDLAWLKRLLTLWGAVFLIHSALTLTASMPGARTLARGVLGVLDVAHLAIVNLLALLGAADMERRLGALQAPPPIDSADTAKPKYAASGLSDIDRAALFHVVEAALADRALYLDPDFALSDLAAAIGAVPREVSEAINGAGATTFFELINGARVEHAKRRLLAEPDALILDIAFGSGFNSKSAFNAAFRRIAGVTPTQFRAARGSSPATARFAANRGSGAS